MFTYGHGEAGPTACREADSKSDNKSDNKSDKMSDKMSDCSGTKHFSPDGKNNMSMIFIIVKYIMLKISSYTVLTIC